MNFKYVLLVIVGLLSGAITVYVTEGGLDDVSIGYFVGIGILILIVIYFHNKFETG